jgi:putative tryptophan/tyrosine transport system substrate-binding protein
MHFRKRKRREFFTLLGGAVAWPLAARAQQQPTTPVVGLLNHGSPPDNSADRLRAFRQGLAETGFVEGRDFAIEFRWANNQIDRLPDLAADLVRRRVNVIATPASTPSSLAAKAATSTIPIVFGIGTDPVQIGLVASFNRPSGNVTGFSSMNWELGAKRLGLLHELLPRAARFAMLTVPNQAEAALSVKDVQAAAATIGRQIEVLTASANRDIDDAFATLVQMRADAILISPDALFLSRVAQIATLAARHAVPTIYPWREAVHMGGLMSYGSSVLDLFRQPGMYAGRILKGEKPADLPALRPTKFELAINLHTAKTIGLEVPPTLLARADEVIE